MSDRGEELNRYREIFTGTHGRLWVAPMPGNGNEMLIKFLTPAGRESRDKRRAKSIMREFDRLFRAEGQGRH